MSPRLGFCCVNPSTFLIKALKYQKFPFQSEKCSNRNKRKTIGSIQCLPMSSPCFPRVHSSSGGDAGCDFGSVRRSFAAPASELAARSVPQQALPWDFPGVQPGIGTNKEFPEPSFAQGSPPNHCQSSGVVLCSPLCQSISRLLPFPCPPKETGARGCGPEG